MDLKTLFEKTIPNHYNNLSKNETHLYKSNVDSVIDETRDRIEILRIENLSKQNNDIAEGLELAKREMSFMKVEIMSNQFKTLSNEK